MRGIIRHLEPRRIGEYEVVARIGSGGMGVVYRAVGPGGLPVAVKVIRPELTEDSAFRARFRREVAACQRVVGPFTARVLDADPDAHQPYLVTEYIDGPSLDAHVREHGPLSAVATRALAFGLAEALTAIHDAGVIHRDLKPSNVLLSSDGPRVIDFGIARATDATQLTGSDSVVGTPAWMAPEQLSGASDTRAIDVFMWGAVVAFAAQGHAPFGGGPPDAVLYRIRHDEPDVCDLAGELGVLVRRALTKDPESRPMARRLVVEMLPNQPGEATVSMTQVVARDLSTTLATAGGHSTHMQPRRRAAAVLATVGMLMLLAAIAVVWFGRHHADPAFGPKAPIAVGAEQALAFPSSEPTQAVSSTPEKRHTPARATERPIDPPASMVSPSPLTDVIVIQPFGVGKPSPNMHVVKRFVGECVPSAVSMRADAYRCFIRSGPIIDPCLSDPLGVADELLCPLDAGGNRFDAVDPNGGLEQADVTDTEPESGPPLYMKLSTGDDCAFMSGATGAIGGLRLNYGCESGGYIYGDPIRDRAAWTVRFQGARSSALKRVVVRRAWF